MLQDWVGRYMQSVNQEREIELKRAQFVADGSQGLFKEIWTQVKTDIASFHDAGGDPGLTAQFISSYTFVLRRIDKYPTIELEVSLRNGHIGYSRKFMFDHLSSEGTDEGQLRIVSDLQGRLQVKRNGEPFKDHSELSRFLLMPVFEYLRKNC